MAYRLGDTLSEHGGVSRGICRVSEEGFLREIQEVHKIDFSPEGGGDSGPLSGITEAGEPLLLTGDEVISRNLWSFGQEFLGLLEDLFLHFLEENGARLDSEFLIPAAVATMLERGDARVRVLSATDLSFGMTHPEDLDGVKRRLEVLTARGVYCTPLFAPGTRRA